MCNKLFQFSEVNGHIKIPKSESKLRNWKQTQVKNHKKGILGKEEYEMLKALGLNFFVLLLRVGKKCAINLLSLARRMVMSRFLNLNQNFETGNTPVQNKGELSKEEYEKLNALGVFNKNMRVNHLRVGKKWEEMYNKLVQFSEVNGHIKIPESESKLRRWKYAQVQNKGELSKERYEKLNTLGVFGKKWEEMCNKLVQFSEVNGHIKIPESESKLRRWKHAQVQNKGELSKERHDKLNALGVFNKNVKMK